MKKTKTTRKETLGFTSFGFSTILLSFVMICVVSFAALSLMTAYSDYKLSKKVADRTTLHYQAKLSAYQKLDVLDTFLSNTYRDLFVDNFSVDDFSTKYYQLLQTNLPHLEAFSAKDLAFTLDSSSVPYVLTFKEPITDNQSIYIELHLLFPSKAKDTFYEIVRWQTVQDEIDLTEDYLNLMK